MAKKNKERYTGEAPKAEAAKAGLDVEIVVEMPN